MSNKALNQNIDLDIGLMFEDPGNERAVLATILTVPSSIIEVSGVLKARDFITPHNKYIFGCIEQLLFTQGMTSFDITSLVNKATSMNILEQCGGYAYIDALFNTRVLYDNLDKYINSVMENSSKKYLYDRLDSLKYEVSKNIHGANVKTSAELLKIADDELAEVLTHSSRLEDAVDLSATIEEYVDELRNSPTSVKGVPTGFKSLDSRINGLLPGSLTILAARAKVGKSMMLLNWARHIALDLEKPILYIDTEMRTEEQMSRLLSRISGIRERNISNGKFASDEKQLKEILRASRMIQRSKMFYHKYMPGVSIENVVRLAKKYKQQKNLGALFFDYIKLTDPKSLNNGVKEHQALGYITSTLKDLAGTLEIPVITAAQVNREGSDRGYLRPDMIADSDRLLRYCNNLLGLSRKTQEELKKDRDIMTDQEFARMIDLNGSHRLQILETRAGGTLLGGLNVTVRPTVLYIEESPKQPRMDDQEDIDDGSDFV
jgi:replicative DNA helicase